MSGAIQYEPTSNGQYPGGVVMVDKIISINEDPRHGYTLIHLQGGGLIRTSTSAADLQKRINALCGREDERCTVCGDHGVKRLPAAPPGEPGTGRR